MGGVLGWHMATQPDGGQRTPVPLQTGNEDSLGRTSPPPAAAHCPPPGPSPILPGTRALRPEAGTPAGLSPASPSFPG